MAAGHAELDQVQGASVEPVEGGGAAMGGNGVPGGGEDGRHQACSGEVGAAAQPEHAGLWPIELASGHPPGLHRPAEPVLRALAWS